MTLDSEMPVFRAISRTVYLAYFSTFFFTYDTISSQDSDFGIPDLGAFLIDSNPESNYFFSLRTVS